MKKIHCKKNISKVLLFNIFSLISCSKYDSSTQMKEGTNSQPEIEQNYASSTENNNWLTNFFKNCKLICYPKPEDLEKEYDNKKEDTLEDANPPHIEITELLEEKNIKNTAAESELQNQNEKEEISLCDISSKGISYQGELKEKIENEERESGEYNKEEEKEKEKEKEEIEATYFTIRREPFNRNTYNFKYDLQMHLKTIEIENFNLEKLEEVFSEYKKKLAKLSINKFIPEQAISKSTSKNSKKLNQTLPHIQKRSIENNFNTGKSYAIRPPTGGLYPRYETKQKVSTPNCETIIEIVSEDNSENSIIQNSKRETARKLLIGNKSDKLFIIKNRDKENFFNKETIENSFSKDMYSIAYNLIMPNEVQKIEAPCTLPSVQEILMILLDVINIKHTSFFNKKFLTRTTINENNVAITFYTGTNQFVFELIEAENIFSSEIHRISVQKLDSKITEPTCFGFINSSIFCCKHFLVKPKYLCHCCYCPPYFICCGDEIEACDCGIPNCFPCCCLPAITGCCVTTLELKKQKLFT